MFPTQIEKQREGKWITLKVTTSTLKTIDKKGISEVLKIAKKNKLI